MKALQRYNDDTAAWENVYNYPMADDAAKKEIKQQRAWAKDDKTGKRFRLVAVTLKS